MNHRRWPWPAMRRVARRDYRLSPRHRPRPRQCRANTRAAVAVSVFDRPPFIRRCRRLSCCRVSRRARRIGSPRGCSSMVELQLPKLLTWVRFPSPAPVFRRPRCARSQPAFPMRCSRITMSAPFRLRREPNSPGQVGESNAPSIVRDENFATYLRAFAVASRRTVYFRAAIAQVPYHSKKTVTLRKRALSSARRSSCRVLAEATSAPSSRGIVSARSRLPRG